MHASSVPDFSDEQFMSAKEKESVLRAWVRFLKNGCTWPNFTIALYHHLTLHCSFIAHYDRAGFYDYYFANPGRQTLRFLDQFNPAKAGISAEIGMTYWLSGPTGADLNRAMRDMAAPYIARLQEQFRQRIKQKDLAVANAIARNYGLALTDRSGTPAPLERTLPQEEAPATQQTLFPE